MSGKIWRKRNPVCCWWDYKSVHPLWKTIQWFHKKIESPYNPAISFKTIYMKERKILIRTDICTPVFTAASFEIAMTNFRFLILHLQTWKLPLHTVVAVVQLLSCV